VRTNLRTACTLVILLFLAAGLTWWLSGDSLARSRSPDANQGAMPYELLFQSEPPPTEPTATLEPTVEPFPTSEQPGATPTLTPTSTATTAFPGAVTPAGSPAPVGTLQPTSTPILSMPEPTMEISPTSAEPASVPTAPGYLPPPTLTSRDALLTDRPPLVGPALLAATSEPQPEPSPDAGTSTGAASGLAGLIDEGLVTFGYAWLCCGVFLLLGVALVLLWLARRGKHS
jgi:hypothetical protein